MNTTPYEIRAYRFALRLCALFQHCQYLEDFENVIGQYNETHARKLHAAAGVSRIAILRNDYVIKFNLRPTEDWDDGTGRCGAGDNMTEEKVYQKAVTDGFEYLLAKTTVVNIGGREIAIMPRINGVGDSERSYLNYVTQEEFDWLSENIYDLHCWNIGYKGNKPVIIDYAWGT